VFLLLNRGFSLPSWDKVADSMGASMAIACRFRLNLVPELEKILCYDWFPTKGSRKLVLGQRRRVCASRLPQDRGPMDTRFLCVYNLARGVFLSSKVTVADSADQPLKILKVLVNGFALDSQAGFWISPLHSAPAVPRLFPFDLLYLDGEHQVIDAAEVLPGVDFPPYRREVASALVLPLQAARSTQTVRGDRLIIGLEEEVERQIAALDEGSIATLRFLGSRRPELTSSGRGKAGVSGVARAAFMAPLAPVAVSENPVMVAEYRDVVETVLDRSVRQSEMSSHAGTVEMPEAELRPTGLREADKVESASIVASIANEPPDTAKGISSKTESPVAIDEEVVQSEVAEIATKASKGEDKRPAQAETPVISITEVVLERPVSSQAPIINGQHGGIEDLFTNWVDAPSFSSAWNAPEPTRERPVSQAPSVVSMPPAEAKPPAGERESQASTAPASHVVPDAVKAKQQTLSTEPETTVRGKSAVMPDPPRETRKAAQVEASKDAEVSKPESKVPQGRTPVQAAGQTRAAIPQPAQTTTFTMAQYGLWQVSMPTAAKHVVALQGTAGERPAAFTAETRPAATEKPDAETGKAQKASPPDSNARPNELNASRKISPSSNVPQPPREKVAAPKGEAPRLEGIAGVSAMKPTAEEPKEQVVRVSNPNALDTKVPATNNVDRFPAKIAEAVEKPSGAKLAAPDPVKVEIPQRTVPATGTKIAAQNAAEAPQKVSADSRATVQEKTAILKQPEGKRTAPIPQSKSLVAGSAPGILKARPKEKPKTSIQRVEENGKPKTSPPSLGERFKRWLNPAAPTNSDRRRAHRRYVPGMIAHYYTGGAPKPHEVADISMTGFYLLTDDRWMPDTMIQMTLQKPCAKGERKQSITVLSKIVRRGSDGIAAKFVMPESLDPHSHDVQPSQATDRFALARFL